MTNYDLCNHPTIHRNKTISFCFKPKGHAGKHKPGDDPADGGYFVVKHLSPNLWGGRSWVWMVTGYTSNGTLILQTSHTTDHSKDMEVRAWESRGSTERKQDGA